MAMAEIPGRFGRRCGRRASAVRQGAKAMGRRT